ncbi:MAG: hypothetical protein JXA43_03660 [Candidatus Diapherotrites archaeon]|nr:hypothetical protein [Candidatus Diapherotrites archaeon]
MGGIVINEGEYPPIVFDEICAVKPDGFKPNDITTLKTLTVNGEWVKITQKKFETRTEITVRYPDGIELNPFGPQDQVKKLSEDLPHIFTPKADGWGGD